MIGAEASEVMAVVEMAMLARLPYTRLRETVLVRPTMAEGLGFLLSNENPAARIVDFPSWQPGMAPSNIRRPGSRRDKP
jgi:hypothetical protein